MNVTEEDLGLNGAPPRLLQLTIGLPYAGKSFHLWGDGALDPLVPVVSPDSIRLALHGQRFQIEAEPTVWAMVGVFIRSLFLAGHQTVIVDATHNTAKRREVYLAVLDTLPFTVDLEYIIFLTPAQVCALRARAVGDTHILSHIARMDTNHEPVPGFPYEAYPVAVDDDSTWGPYYFRPALDVGL